MFKKQLKLNILIPLIILISGCSMLNQKDPDVIVTTDKEVIYAEGFSSDPNFKDYTLKKISGRMYVNSINN